MKKRFLICQVVVSVLILFLITDCKKEEPKLAVVYTTPVTNITQTTASAGGNVMDDGGAAVINRGVTWSTTHYPTVGHINTKDGVGIGTFSSKLSGLSGSTTYYVRAFATNSAGTGYGNEVSFKSNEISLATLTTTNVTAITSTTALSGGKIPSDGGTKVTEWGVCLSTSQNPTISDQTIKITYGLENDVVTDTIFKSILTGLIPNTNYFVKAYAINSLGIAYGNEISFTTNSIRLATLTTTSASEITVASAVSGGEISDNGEGEITDEGICWATTRNPTTSNNLMTLYGFDNFAGIINGLQPSTKYYVRSYATNGAGTTYGNELNFVTPAITPIIFNPDLTYGSVLDIDGNTYKTIMIGTQVWMAENLRTTKYNDGTSIPYATDNSVINGFSWYNHDAGSYKSSYGALYTWGAATDSRNVCPTGWHVPSNEEWFIMKTYLGPGDNSVADKMKEAGKTHWLSPNTASNGSGFTALPGGIGWGTAGQFTNIGYDGSWWSASSSDPSGLGADIISISSAYSDEPTALKTYGISVRCMKDN